MNNLDYFKRFIFYFYTFSVRRSIDVLDPENQPGSDLIWTGSGSRAYKGRQTPRVRKQKIEIINFSEL